MNQLIKQLHQNIGGNNLLAALNTSRQILNLKPSEYYHYYNHGILCLELDLLEEAADSLIQARNLLPNCPVIRRMLSDILCTLGRFEEGLKEKEWRFNFPIEDSPVPITPNPIVLEILPRLRNCYPGIYWDGKISLIDKTILVFTEGGYGDAIQNVRFLKQLKQKGCKIILDIKEELYDLMQCLENVEVITTTKEKRAEAFGMTFSKEEFKLNLPKYDYVVSLHSLLYYFDPELQNIPMTFPYLTPKQGKKLINSNKLKIGIVWAGNEKNESDEHRSTYKRNFEPLMQIPNSELFSLQQGKMIRTWNGIKINLLENSENVITTNLKLNNFNETALILKELDLLVSVDTSVSHLAGALDVPVYTIMPEVKKYGDYRWHRKWYNSQQIIFQEYKNENWLNSMEQVVKKILKNF